MKNIRIGNDIWFKWQILRDEGVETWDGKDIKVTLRDSYGMECAVEWRKDEGGVISGVCRGRAQKRLGLYTLTLTENDGKDNMGCVDSVDAWRLVARQNASIVDEEERDGALGVEVVMLTSKVGIGTGEGITIDTELNEESNNAIANAAVTNKFFEQEEEMTEMQGRIDNNATDIASKASQAELSRMRNDLEKADTANSNAIAEVREALAGKADSTEVTNSVNELKEKDTTQDEIIAQQQEAVAANTAVIAEHTATLVTHDSRITANSDKITALEAKAIDAELSETSENAVQNKVVTAAIQSLQASIDEKANKSDLASKADASSVNASISDINTKNSAQDTEINNLKSSASDLSDSLNALSESALIIKAKGNGAQINIDGTNTDIEANKRVVKKGFTNITFTSTTSYEMNRRANIVFVSIQNFKPNSMYNMFRKCSGLTRINVDGWDTSAVGDMRNVFMECSNLRGLDLTSWDTSSATDIRYMFSYCQAATEIDVRGWNTANVTNMDGVFRACSQLTNLDVSSWDTSKVQSLEYMFAECPKLKSLDLSSWNLSSVNNIRNIFAGSSEIEELTLGEHFGRVQKWAGSIDFSPLTKWTGSSVQTLRSLCNRKDFGIGTLTLKLSSQTKAALGSEGISQLTAKGYTIA